jgi:hypothetical protein
MPGDAGVTCGDLLVCFLISHARLRAHRAPGIPCALCFLGERFLQTSGDQRRENAEACLLDV